jgi:Mg/Co/Ni transporter MgtE
MFMPVISAIAGNVGLQTSSSIASLANVRREQGRVVNPLEVARIYLTHNICNILIMSVIMSGVAFLWDSTDPCRLVHALTILCGSLVNMTIASLFGVATPMVAARLNFDPSAG